MEILNIAATDKTPSIIMNAESGRFEIKGKSVPIETETFYAPILRWLESYAESPAPVTIIDIDLDFFNISSSKRILFILYRLNELADQGHSVQLKWHYFADDDDMYEVGQDYAFMVKLPFEFVEKNRNLAAVV